MLCVPVERVTVMLALVRSRMTVSLRPEVTPELAAPGRRGVGRVCVPTGVTWLGPVTGATGVWPLFQVARVLQSPLVSVIQTAGSSWSLRYSMSPRRTFTSRLFPPLLKLGRRAVLAYCQKSQGFGSP